MVQAIAKRRQLPTSGTPMESLESTRGVSRPGPNSSAAFAAGKEMTLTSLSVSSAKRTGPGAFSGATIHAGRASAPEVSGRNATAVAGPPTALPRALDPTAGWLAPRLRLSGRQAAVQGRHR